MQTEAMYDELAGNYLHPGRNSTTTFFRNLQQPVISRFIARACETAGRYYGDSKVLIVGAGPQGNFDEYSGLHRLVGPLLDEIDTRNVTYLDASVVMLGVCRKYISGQLLGLRLGEYIKGQAERLGDVLEPASQDIVIGALCDHFKPDHFFRESWSVLKPGGALVVTFPADGVNRVIRERLYGIDAGYTRFMLNGNPVLVPSKLMTTKDLSSLYDNNNFTNLQVEEVKMGGHVPSSTILAASQLLKEPLGAAPILVAGLGFKPSRQE